MKIHPTSIKGFDTLEEAARAIAKLRYDALSVFLGYLTEDLSRQQKKDLEVGKTALADDTLAVLSALATAEDAVGALFQKYKHYMAEELEIKPEIKHK